MCQLTRMINVLFSLREPLGHALSQYVQKLYVHSLSMWCANFNSMILHLVHTPACLCACMPLCVYAFMHVCLYTCTFLCMRTSIHVCLFQTCLVHEIQVCTSAYFPEYMEPIHIYSIYLYTCMHTYIHTYIRVLS